MAQPKNNGEAFKRFAEGGTDFRCGNVSASGDTFYSYQAPIAQRRGNRIAWVTSRKYSATTTAHTTGAQGALSRAGWRVYRAHAPPKSEDDALSCYNLTALVDQKQVQLERQDHTRVRSLTQARVIQNAGVEVVIAETGYCPGCEEHKAARGEPPTRCDSPHAVEEVWISPASVQLADTAREIARAQGMPFPRVLKLLAGSKLTP